MKTLPGEEASVTKSQGQSLAGMLGDAVEGGGREIVIRNVIVLDGRQVAESVARNLPRVLATHGVG
jgi:hypothetical protein